MGKYENRKINPEKYLQKLATLIHLDTQKLNPLVLPSNVQVSDNRVHVCSNFDSDRNCDETPIK